MTLNRATLGMVGVVYREGDLYFFPGPAATEAASGQAAIVAWVANPYLAAFRAGPDRVLFCLQVFMQHEVELVIFFLSMSVQSLVRLYAVATCLPGPGAWAGHYSQQVPQQGVQTAVQAVWAVHAKQQVPDRVGVAKGESEVPKVAFEQVFFGGGELGWGAGRGVRGPQRGSRGGRFKKTLQIFQFGASCVQPRGLGDAAADRPGAGGGGGFGQVAVSRAAGARGRTGLAGRRRRQQWHRARRHRLPVAAGPPGRPHGATQLSGPGPGPRTQPQMVSEQHGEEEQGRQGQSPSLRPLRIGARFVARPGSPAAAAAADSQRGSVFPGPHPSAPEHISGGSGLEGVDRREAGRPSQEGGLRTAPRSSAPSRLYLGGCMARQANRPGAPLRPESRGALGPSLRPSRAPSLAAGAPPPGPLGAARRPGGGRCGALGRWRLRRRRRTPHSVGPLSCPGLRATSLRAPGPPARTLFRPSRLSAALRPSAPPCGPRRAPLCSTPLPSPAPLLSRPSARSVQLPASLALS